MPHLLHEFTYPDAFLKWLQQTACRPNKEVPGVRAGAYLGPKGVAGGAFSKLL